MPVALYPGSFDPLHNGHLAVIAMAAPLFEQVIVGVGHNPEKPSGLFTPDERIAMIKDSVHSMANVTVELFSGLVTDTAHRLGADCLLKGLRGGSDLDVEMQQAHMNLTTGSVTTVFLPGLGSGSLVASSYVRQIASMGGDVSGTVPAPVRAGLERKFGR
jgi:pantetheine-phosphate adenylyltransferase